MNEVTHAPTPRTPFGRLSAAMLLGVALIASACSSDATQEAAPATSTPSTITTPNAAPSTTPRSDAPSSNSATVLDELESGGFEGVVAVRDGDTITTRAYGTADRDDDVPIDAETVFDIGSLTKQFTAAAILRLEMDGQLSVDNTIGQHLPDLPADKAAITLHQLLTHTAGVANNFGFDDEPIDRNDFLTLFRETPLPGTPGGEHAYSNVGYALLAAVIESATGGSYESYLRTALFEPAGMLDTGYVLPDWDDHTIAVGYDGPAGDRFGRPNERPWDVDGPYWNLHGNGGLLSTAGDMLRWDEALQGNQVLDDSAKAKFTAPHVLDGPEADNHYGYGWYIVSTPMGTPLITHNGGNGVFFADLLRFVDQDLTVFVTTNSFEADDLAIAYVVANELLDDGLAPMLGDDSGDEIEGDRDITEDATANECGFDGLSIESLPAHPELEALPDSPAGRTIEIFLDLLANGDEAARLDFATDHVTASLGGGDPAAVAQGIVDLQQTFARYEVTRISREDARRFHLLMQGPDDELLLSLGFDQSQPDRLRCLAVSP